MSALPRVGIALGNPIMRKCARSRLRLRHILSWGTITVTITGFVFMLVYLTATERGITDTASAAKATLLPVIIIQSIIMMLLGTGSVAGGLARERESGLLDYHRMTPMSPTSKILGFLFGLPVREYFLFSLTLPFIGFAVVVGQFSLLTLLHFYTVFFTSVWVYHLTGLVAGMVSSKPRFASIVAQGLVVVLYLVLPQLAFVGLTFFEFLTIRPTLYGMVMQELGAAQPGLDQAAASAFSELAQYREVPFFNWRLHPTVFTLLVQGFLISAMWVIIYRKWCDQHRHPFSKVHALLCYGMTMFFLIGNLWPIVADETIYAKLIGRLGLRPDLVAPLQILFLLLEILLVLCGFVCLLMVHLVTPSQETMLKGWRRAHKYGRRRLPFNSDAASSLPVTVAMILLTFIGGLVLLRRTHQSERFFEQLPPLLAASAPPVLFAAILLFVQALRERFGARIFSVGLFLLWMVPMFTCLVMFAAFEAWVPGSYVALPFPPLSLGLSIGHALEETRQVGGAMPSLLPPDLEPHAVPMVVISLGAYIVSGAAHAGGRAALEETAGGPRLSRATKLLSLPGEDGSSPRLLAGTSQVREISRCASTPSLTVRARLVRRRC